MKSICLGLVIIFILAGCSALPFQRIYTDRCNSSDQCLQQANLACNGPARILSIENPEGENEEPLFGGGVSPGGAILGSLISDAADAAMGQLLEVHFTCPPTPAL